MAIFTHKRVIKVMYIMITYSTIFHAPELCNYCINVYNCCVLFSIVLLQRCKSMTHTSLNIHRKVINIDITITKPSVIGCIITVANNRTIFSSIHNLSVAQNVYCFIPLILLTCQIYEKINNYFFLQASTVSTNNNYVWWIVSYGLSCVTF